MRSVGSSTRIAIGRIHWGTARPACRSRSAWRPIWDDMAARVVFVRSKSPAGMEPRVAKEAATLARAGYEVHAVLWDRECAFPAEETHDGVRVHRYQLRAPEGQPDLIALLPRWWWHAFRRIASLRPQIVHAVDFDTILPASASARLAGAKLVYDIFDFYAEMVTADLSPRFREVLAKWERRMIDEADLVILPDLRRKVQFEAARPKRLVEIMNLPEHPAVTTRAEDPSHFVVFYGGMIANDPGLVVLVVAFQATGARFIVAGHGPDEATLLNTIETSPASTYLGTIPYQEVLER